MFQGLKDLMINGASYEPSEVMQLPNLERLTLGQAYEFANFSVFSRMPNLRELTRMEASNRLTALNSFICASLDCAARISPISARFPPWMTWRNWS